MRDTARRADRRRLGVGAAVVAVIVVAAVAIALTRPASQPPVALRGSIAFVHGNDILVATGDPARTSTLTTETTSGDESCCTLAWSSDGRRLLIGSSEHLSTVAADGSAHTEIVDEQALSGTPTWSPDGSHLAVAFEVDGSPRLFVVNADGSGQRDVTPDRATIGDVGSYAWSPDGREIAFGAAIPTAASGATAMLGIVAASGGAVRTVATAAGGLEITQWSSPAFSPDGRSVVYDVSAGSPLDIHLEVVSVGPDAAASRRLSPAGDDAYAPVWSPDGRRIAFTVWRGGTGPADLYVMNVDGSSVTKLADNVGPNDHPWSPDGGSIAFGRTDAGAGLDGLWVVHADSGDAVRVSEQAATGGITWRGP